jgi:chemotaxis protein CheD
MTQAHETMVRMGEMAVSSDRSAVLTTIGLGSCIGLVLLDRSHTIGGLAHIVLPATDGRDASTEPGKFADSAVPELVRQMRMKGARPGSLQAVLVGGASMFGFKSGSLDIGERNESATREMLAKQGIAVVAADTRGSAGRTVRVRLADLVVTAKTAGQAERELITGGRAAA